MNSFSGKKKSAVTFIIFIGLVSLFADMTYEGARSISGPYLALLGANALAVGMISGLGELVGYSLRMASGYLADRTKKYWLITIIGYTVNLLAVPLLALADQWWLAASLLIIERFGKAIRVPTRDAMLAHASQQMGMGWGFGLHEALDKTGAMLGPLLMAVVLFYCGEFKVAFAILAIPAMFALFILVLARRQYPDPHLLEIQQAAELSQSQKRSYWLYLAGAALIAAGYADFPLIAYHFEKSHVLPKIMIPIAYAIAMGVDAGTALLLGRLYDKNGFIVLMIITILTSLFAPLVFLGSKNFALLGVLLWSVGIGAHESLMRAIIATMVSKDKRASAYGVFNMGFGISWFLGSVIMGALYDYSISWLVVFAFTIQLTAVPFFWLIMRNNKQHAV